MLAEHFLTRHAARLNRPVPALDSTTLDALRAYAWPGNVRELENLMERNVVLGEMTLPGGQSRPITPEPGVGDANATSASLALQPRVEELERQLLASALASSGGAKAGAARLLEISERTLWYKIKKYGLR